jgi:hypothetical protein
VYKDETDQGQSDVVQQISEGLKAGKISQATAERTTGALKAGHDIHAHYVKYPKDTAGFESWAREADRLWASVPGL